MARRQRRPRGEWREIVRDSLGDTDSVRTVVARWGVGVGCSSVWSVQLEEAEEVEPRRRPAVLELVPPWRTFPSLRQAETLLERSGCFARVRGGHVFRLRRGVGGDARQTRDVATLHPEPPEAIAVAFASHGVEGVPGWTMALTGDAVSTTEGRLWGLPSRRFLGVRRGRGGPLTDAESSVELRGKRPADSRPTTKDFERHSPVPAPSTSSGLPLGEARPVRALQGP